MYTITSSATEVSLLDIRIFDFVNTSRQARNLSLYIIYIAMV